MEKAMEVLKEHIKMAKDGLAHNEESIKYHETSLEQSKNYKAKSEQQIAELNKAIEKLER